MAKKKLLLIADLDSIHTFNYVRNVLPAIEFDVTAIDIKGSLNNIRDEYKEFYIKQGLSLEDGVDVNLIKKGGYLKYFLLLRRRLKDLGSFDVLHIKGVYNYIAPSVYMNHRRYKKIILTYWGSDLYRSSKNMLLQTLPLVSVSDRISFITEDMRAYFKTLPYLFRKNLSKSCILDYGNMFYEKIERYCKRGKVENKKILGLSDDKITVTIGYHGRPQMQQLRAIKCIIENDIKCDNIQFCIPTYGITNEDLNELKTYLQTTTVDYRILEGFMDEDRVSTFRAATDIFIHPQTSDALSCAMLEHLYANNIVLNGRWLNYGILDEHDIRYIKYDDFDDLPKIFGEVIKKIDAFKQEVAKNQNKVASITSWKVLRDGWLELYK